MGGLCGVGRRCKETQCAVDGVDEIGRSRGDDDVGGCCQEIGGWGGLLTH